MSTLIDCPLSIKNMDEKGSFSGYASVFDITDAHYECVARGAFDKSLKHWKQTGKFPKLLWQHNAQKPIGLWHEIYEDPHGLFVKGQLLLDLQQGREAYTLLKNGVIDGLSIGFTTIRARHSSEERNKGKQALSRIRVLEEIDLQEVSLVTFAANSAARVSQVKEEERGSSDLLRRLDNLGALLRKGKKLQLQ
jgi:HK97 family phage prohead protease